MESMSSKPKILKTLYKIHFLFIDLIGFIFFANINNIQVALGIQYKPPDNVHYYICTVTSF